MKSMARCWIIGLLAACGLPQAQAANVTLGTMHTESATRNAVWASDGCPTAEIVRCSGAGDACESVADDLCAPCDKSDCCSDGDQVRWTVTPWIGGTSIDAGTTEGGFAEGVYGGYRLTDSLGIYGGFGFNHTSDRTQFIGTVGLQRFGDPNGATASERLSLWGFWDYYTDDELDADAHQLRFNAGYVFRDFAEAGVTFSIAIDDDGTSISPMGGANLMFPGGNFVGGYYAQSLRWVDLFAQIGYLESADGIAGSLMLKRGITERSRVFVGASGAGDSSVSGILGMEVGLGRDDTWKR